MKPDAIIIHCSASPDRPNFVDWKGIADYHYRVLGWTGSVRGGYNYYVETSDGGKTETVIEGRPLTMSGAHCQDGGMNSHSIGICMIGGDPYTGFGPDYPMTDLKWATTVNLCAKLCLEHNIPVDQIFPHNHFNKGKTCPGIGFDINKFRDAVNNAIGRPVDQKVCPTCGRPLN